MILTKKLKEELEQLYVKYFESLFNADVKSYESFFVDNFIQIGTTREEVWFSKSESGTYLGTFVKPVAGKIEFRNRDIRLVNVDQLVLIIEQADCYIKSEGVWTFYDQVRVSSLMKKTDIGWKFVQQHISFPDSRTEKGQTVALEKIKAENIQLKNAVKSRTIELERINKELENVILKLKSTQAQLIQSEKLAAFGQLTVGIAHEIQNPLNFVNNFSEVSRELIEQIKSERLKIEGERDDELEDELLNDIAQNLEKICHHGNRADEIVKAMLEHSRPSTGENVPTDINTLTDEFLKLSYHRMRAKHKNFQANFEIHLDPDLPKVNVIPQQIGRALLNIINNAFQAISVNDLSGSKNLTDIEPKIPLVFVSTKTLDDKIEISISDNGTGIPDAIKDKIFQPFFTTKPTGHGTGLGLSLSYDIVKAHGGEIKVESQVGKGTTFSIQLPI